MFFSDLYSFGKNVPHFNLDSYLIILPCLQLLYRIHSIMSIAFLWIEKSFDKRADALFTNCCSDSNTFHVDNKALGCLFQQILTIFQRRFHLQISWAIELRPNRC